MIATIGGWDYDTCKEVIVRDLDKINSKLFQTTLMKIKKWEPSGVRASTASAVFKQGCTVEDLLEMKEELNVNDFDFKLENGNNCFIAPRKSKEQITIDKALNSMFLGL